MAANTEESMPALAAGAVTDALPGAGCGGDRWLFLPATMGQKAVRSLMAVANKKPAIHSGVRVFVFLQYILVPGAGIEPALPCGNEILSLGCLPIPPSRQTGTVYHRRFSLVNRLPRALETQSPPSGAWP